MRAILYNFKYILLLSLFNIFLSLYINKDNLDLQNTIIDIPDNHITNIDLKKNQNITLSIPYENDKDLLLSIKSLNNKKFSFFSDNEFINYNNSNIEIYRNTIDKSQLNKESKTLIIDINSNDDNNNLEIINIVDNGNISEYQLIEENNKKYTVYSPNFVIFFNTEEKKNVKVEINFNDEINESLYYAKVNLSTNDIKYIPRVFNLDETIYKYTKKDFKKYITIDIDDEFKEGPKGNKDCKIIAFIFSIKTNSNIKYSVTFKIEEMNWFLIGSIILALIFAVITFFLIRRKKNVNETNEEEGEYNVNKQDEGEGEGENPN